MVFERASFDYPNIVLNSEQNSPLGGWACKF